MTDDPTLSRRRLLTSLVGAAAGVVLCGVRPRVAFAVGARLPSTAAALGGGRAFASFGAWLRTRMGAAAADALMDAQEGRLARLTAQRLGNPAEAVRLLIAEDFFAARTVNVDGLRLSELESALCLAAALRWPDAVHRPDSRTVTEVPIA
ncbi:hypothetical protein [Azospirillum halopraeferens]|uniref:hypothetical protein n=1 Tax=Azospirillum halopraeferens TaxID=34010 RepID=UPI00040D494C|nr:hypothetical protein [Azospirillum halopraeferens]